MKWFINKLKEKKSFTLGIMILILFLIPTVYILVPVNGYYAKSWISGGNKDTIYGKHEGKKIKNDSSLLNEIDKDMECKCFKKLTKTQKNKLKKALKSKNSTSYDKLPEKTKKAWETHAVGVYYHPSKHVSGAIDSTGEINFIPDTVATNILGDIFAGFLEDINQYVYNLGDFLGLTIKNITLGRIDGAGIIDGDGNRIALYTFEMANGNIYSIASMAIYNILRNSIYILLICIILVRLVYLLWKNDTSQIIASFKENVANMIIVFILLTVMPYFLDIAIFIRDNMLYLLVKMEASVFGIDSVDLTEVFKEVANKKNNWISQAMYGASFWLCIYFAWNYIKTALMMCVHIIVFPFLCVLSFFDKQVMGSWVKGMVECMIIPIIDSSLLLIPALFGLIGDSFAVYCVQFVICLSVIPTRKQIGRVLNLNTVANSGATGIGLMLGMGRLASALGVAVAGIGSSASAKMTESAMNAEKANLYSDMAKAERGIFPQFSSMGSGLELKKPGVHLSGMNKGGIDNKLNNTESMLEDAAILGEEGMIAKVGLDNSGQFGQTNKSVLKDKTNTTGKKIESDIQPDVYNNGMEGGIYDSDGADKQSMDNVQSPLDEGLEEDYTSAYNNKNGNGSISSMQNGKNTNYDSIEMAKQQVLQKHANKFNVDSPAFKDLSNERKAELYRQRASYQKQQALSNAVGKGALAFSGAMLATSLGMFMGPEALTMGVGMGVGAGSSISKAWDTMNNISNTGFVPDTTNIPVQPNRNLSVEHMPSEMPSKGEMQANSSVERMPSDSNSSFTNPDVDFDVYNAEFVRRNTKIISDENMAAFKGFKTNMGDEMNNYLTSAYQKYPDDYEAFRNEVTRQYSDDLTKRLQASTSSVGNSKLDKRCIDHLVQDYSTKYINPVDKSGKQVAVPANHIFSKANLEARGIKYN